MAVVASTKRRWLERTSGDEIPLAGDAPAWAASLLIHVVVLLALALIGTGNLEPRPRAITIVAPVAPVEDDVLVAPEMVIAPEQASAAASAAENLEVAMAVAPELAADPLVTLDVAATLDGEIAIARTPISVHGTPRGSW